MQIHVIAFFSMALRLYTVNSKTVKQYANTKICSFSFLFLFPFLLWVLMHRKIKSTLHLICMNTYMNCNFFFYFQFGLLLLALFFIRSIFISRCMYESIECNNFSLIDSNVMVIYYSAFIRSSLTLFGVQPEIDCTTIKRKEKKISFM